RLLRSTRILSPQSEMAEATRRILWAWQEWASGHGNLTITIADLHQQLAPQMDPGAFSRHLKELRVSDCVEIVNRGPRGRHHLQLTPLGETYSGCDLLAKLPTPDEVRVAQAELEERDGQPHVTEQVAADALVEEGVGHELA
ncbi:MAG: hypothetical protein KDA51_18490, partial [Planctomycetales bacterium]|nr:hypothetical protein [Planctomycetales bacterium]